MKKRIAMLFSCVLTAFSMTCLCYAHAAPAEGEEIRLPIIMYHQISKNPNASNAYTILPQTFEADMEYLHANGYTSITTQQLLAYARGEGTLPDQPVLITFDDGYESFDAYAKPVLERYGMSAVLAIVGSFSDLYTQQEDHNLNYSHFSWAALAALQQSPAVELAVHTYDMHKLDSRQGCRIRQGENAADYDRAFNADLEKIEGRFQEHLSLKPNVFAYPYGFYCKEAKEILRQRGYQILFTCEEHVNTLTGDPEELMNLGRFNRPSGIGTAQFFAKIM